MRESFFAAPRPESGTDDRETSIKAELEKNKERRELIENTRVAWMANAMRLKELFPFDDVPEDATLELVRGRYNEYLSHIDQLAGFEKKLDEEDADLKRLLN